MKYVELSGVLGDGTLKEVSKKELLQRASASPAVFNGLVEKRVFEVYQREIGRLNRISGQTVELNVLNEHQQRAYDEIVRSFQEKNVCLLHGVTSSGKTEVYIHLIEDALRQGKQVLYLLPEIALTTQITERLKRVFGSRLGIYHSKFPDAERVEIWQKQLTEEGYDIILGCALRYSSRSGISDWSLWTKSTRTLINSRTPRHAIMPAMPLSYWLRCMGQRRC